MRVRCSNCETEQEAASESAVQTCVACGKPVDTRPAVPVLDVPRIQASPRLAEVGPDTTAARELEELVASERRLLTLAVWIPFWGAWRIARSELHSPREKQRLIVESLTLTAALLMLVWTALPKPADQIRFRREHARAQILALAPLVERYRTQFGSYPDLEAWQRSAKPQDRRFLDPWDRLYVYYRDGEGFALGTLGRDGVTGGLGEDEDLFIAFRPPADEEARTGETATAE